MKGTPIGKHLQAVLLAVLLLSGTGCGGGNDTGGDGEAADTLAADTLAADMAADTSGGGGALASGEEVFKGQGICYTCHGQNAEGTALAPNLSDQEWINLTPPVTPETIAELVRTGVPTPKQHPAPMPPKGGSNITDEQVEAVAAYVYSLSQ